MPRQTINTHVGRVQFIADAHIQVSGEDPEDFVTDILADLQHWAAAQGKRFGASSLMRAQWQSRPSRSRRAGGTECRI
jgi:hypothetical protein